MQVKRMPQNPLLQPGDIAPLQKNYTVECLLNPAISTYQEKVLMLVRVAEAYAKTNGKITVPYRTATGYNKLHHFDETDPALDLSDARLVKYDGVTYLSTISHLRLMESADGIHFSEPSSPLALVGEGPYETFGIEDCRISKIGLQYYLTYTAVSEFGVAVGMRSTCDWKTFQNHGLILPPHNKDCALFEKQIRDTYYCLHRPSGLGIGGNFIWLSQSNDLLHWGNHLCIAATRKGFWDSERIGAGCAPIETETGWLMIYHGANEQQRYCLGGLLLDLNDPSKVIARSATPIMEPSESYETSGFFNDVVFTNGHLVEGDRLIIYYGAADKVICAAEFSIKSVLSSLAYL